MNIYLKWNSFFFNKKENIPIFDLEISQEEDHFARAKLNIKAGILLPPTGTEGTIQGEGEKIFFRGALVGAPLKIEGPFAEIQLIAKPPDFQEKIIALQKDNRIPPYWDDLWIRPEKQTHFQEIQESRTSSLYCDRRTGKLFLSDWFEGRENLFLDQHFFQDSLHFKAVNAPLKACTINVHAHWIQSDSGISNMSSDIRRAFPRFKVNTYTKQALLEKWPERGHRIGRSGFWIMKSELKPVIPNSPLYPRYSPPIPLRKEEDHLQSFRIERHWFKPLLWVGWHYQQKRKETLSLTLEHAVQTVFPGEGEVKVLDFTLQNINPDPRAYLWREETFYREGAKVIFKNEIYRCKTAHYSGISFEEGRKHWTFKRFFHTPLGHSARSSFFLTKRGYQAAEHAMERAKITLAKSARCFEVSFEGPWETLYEVTTDTTLSLIDSRLPGGKIKGKVVKYALIAKGETGERFVRVTLLCAVGLGEAEKTDYKSFPHYALNDYCEESYQVYENAVQQTPSGLFYLRYDDKVPPQGIKRGPFLRHIELTNGPEEQEAEMRKYALNLPFSLKKALSHQPTRLRLYFKDLRTKERLEHLIPVTMAASWSAPQQCSLYQEKVF